MILYYGTGQVHKRILAQKWMTLNDFPFLRYRFNW